MSVVQEYKEYHTDTEVHFQLFFTAAKLQEVLSGGGPHQKLKLIGKASIGESCCLLTVAELSIPLHLCSGDVRDVPFTSSMQASGLRDKILISGTVRECNCLGWDTK